MDLMSVFWNATYAVQPVAILAGLVLPLIGFALGLSESDEELLGDVLSEGAAPGA